MFVNFPFTQEDYDKGWVVRMPRSELVAIVKRNAADARIRDEVYDALVQAVERKQTATVAVGLYYNRRVPECGCPAYHAGYVKWDPEPGYPHESFLHHDEGVIGHFPLYFDSAMRHRYPDVRVIEVVG